MAVAIGIASWNIYRSWNEGPWDLPTAPAPAAAETAAGEQVAAAPRPLINTDVIVSKNLFDPERGAGATREAEENSRAFQRLRNMILVGTVIIGNNRTAILQDGSNPNVPAGAPNQTAVPMRLKLGDNVEGFRLSEIGDKRVVFSKDASRVELLLDYFRKVEVAQPRTQTPTRTLAPGQVTPPGPVAPVPRVIPNLPRRARIPTPGDPTPDS